MEKICNVETYSEFVDASKTAAEEKGVIIEIKKDIILESCVEFNDCSELKIKSENGCSLIGGIVNAKWENQGAFLTCSVSEEPRMLIINDKAVKKTSFPEDGYLENTDISEYEWLNSRNGGWDKKPTQYDLTHITVKKEDIPSGFDTENCDIRVIHTWDESTVSVKNYDEATGIIECKSLMAHPAGAFDVHKYQFLNTACGKPQKGRWYYNRSEKKIYYCPKDGENEENLKSMIPCSKSLVKLTNCKNVEISNIKLTLSNSEPGEISGLRAINPCGAVQVENSENINLDMLEVEFSGGQGIKFLKSKNIRITNSIIESCASCGIATFECEDEYIAYNVIQNVGLSDFSAVALHAGGKSELVFVMDGCVEEHGKTVIEYNTIASSPYCGIVCSGGPHTIANNKITRCMQVLKDGGALYCSRAAGTVIKDNYVSYIPSDTAYAYYLDELSENCVVDGNVSVNVNIPFKSHIVKNCRLSNNLFVNDEETVLAITRSDGVELENNLVISKKDIILNVKSYIPEEEYNVGNCLSLSGNVLCAPAVKAVPDKECELKSCETPEYKEENGYFAFKTIPKGISNRYIVSKTEPHCVVTKIKPEKEEEYKKLHDEIWDMVVKNGHLYNIRNYSIFKFRDMYVSFFEYVGDDFKADMQKKALLPVTKRWQKLCSQCFEEIKEAPENIFFNRF